MMLKMERIILLVAFSRRLQFSNSLVRHLSTTHKHIHSTWQEITNNPWICNWLFSVFLLFFIIITMIILFFFFLHFFFLLILFQFVFRIGSSSSITTCTTPLLLSTADEYDDGMVLILFEENVRVWYRQIVCGNRNRLYTWRPLFNDTSCIS